MKTQIHGQNVDSIITNINVVVASIDSNKTLPESISEGEIELNDSTIGGYELYELRSKNLETLHRVIENYSTDTLISKTYYFKNNKPIYAIIETSIWENKTSKNILNQKIYFSQGIVIKNMVLKSEGYLPKMLYREALSFLKN